MKLISLQDIPLSEVSHNPAIKKRVMLSPGEIPAVTNFSVATFPPEEIAHAHSHSDMTEVFFIQSGTGTITVDDEEIELSEGHCITVEPGETHELRNTGTTELVVMYFGIAHGKQEL